MSRFLVFWIDAIFDINGLLVDYVLCYIVLYEYWFLYEQLGSNWLLGFRRYFEEKKLQKKCKQLLFLGEKRNWVKV